jgi:TrkA domain protein
VRDDGRRAEGPRSRAEGTEARSNALACPMMGRMDVNEVLLPGVGVRYEFTDRDGNLVGVVARRDGEFEVVVYDVGDPDTARPAFRLDEDEAEALAQILGAPRIAERFADLTKEVPGLNAGQVEIREGSPFVDEPLGSTRARTRTGASVVAVVRDDNVIASPGPEEVLRAGDILVVIGTSTGIAGVTDIVTRG